MAEGLFIEWEILIGVGVGVGIPAGAAAIAVIRHFWNKSKCFIILKEKVEQLAKDDAGSSDTHSDLYDKVNKIERNLFHLMGRMKIDPID